MLVNKIRMMPSAAIVGPALRAVAFNVGMGSEVRTSRRRAERIATRYDKRADIFLSCPLGLPPEASFQTWIRASELYVRVPTILVLAACQAELLREQSC